MKHESTVRLWREQTIIPTYEPEPADPNPMFLEKRVYQGSSGKVYPLPFIDRIAENTTDRAWDAVHLENEYISLMILPEIGGRIHIGADKTNGYDFLYRQDVIKPALVGLAGPWISGGIEFNWPQHHRPSTFMPVDVELEEDEDGSKTIWLSEHEPMNRMKGMHGVRLYPGRSYVELLVRLYNRTPLVQTFLWWANVAARVNDNYQSFFPPDVSYVADHAKRAMSQFPICRDSYYGVDYSPGTRLDWYKNIPVPTSYMAVGSSGDFFGGYDHGHKAGFVHVANHHISPGKKQWTWGNHKFGWAWDRNLSDDAGPYVELMAGVYTDNQPDFSFLHPGETKSFSQFWYPIREIGPPQHATKDAAVSLTHVGDEVTVGVSVTSVFADATIRVCIDGELIKELRRDLSPDSPFVETMAAATGTKSLSVHVSHNGRTLIDYTHKPLPEGEEPLPATEPPLPADVASVDELYLVGLHLEQYRHATREPADYWCEALSRDPGDLRCNNALGLWHLRRGELEDAVQCFQTAIARSTSRNPNPYDGEPYYNLGNALRFLERYEEAYAAFYKSTWNYAWQSPAFHALAELDCRNADWETALEHLDRSLRVNTDNLRARDLKSIVLRKLNRPEAGLALLKETKGLDPLDFWATHLLGEEISCGTQTRLDVALDFARAGLYAESIDLLDKAGSDLEPGTAPLVSYYLGYFQQKQGNTAESEQHFDTGRLAPSTYCFPSRLEEIAILQAAIETNPRDSKAPFYLGNLFYDRKRHREAIELWQQSLVIDANFSIAWRNLGLASYNILDRPNKALSAYNNAFRSNPADARLFYERDQLFKRVGTSPKERLAELRKQVHLVHLRDDLSVELCSLYNQLGEHDSALRIMSTRKFQPWEGGEGLALGQYVRTQVSLGRLALTAGEPYPAQTHFQAALDTPENLGEARHLLANQSDVYYWLAEACSAKGDIGEAEKYWNEAASFTGDFQEMSVRLFSEMTYYQAKSLQRLGRDSDARELLEGLREYSVSLKNSTAKIDYFATSLPTMLIFETDLQKRQEIQAAFLGAQAELGLGNTAESSRLIADVLREDPNHQLAADFLGEIRTRTC